MKKKNRIWIYQLLILVILLTATNSCEKDDAKSKKDPVITWANPADMTYGALLSAIQLNATADVAGTFVYTPTIGTKLNEGNNQDLKVDFTPTDVTVYNSASKIVKVNVTVEKGTVTDIDGNVYKTVKIGNQWWMAENLKTMKYNDGSAIPQVEDSKAWTLLTSPAFCWRNDTYGLKYNWYAVNTGKLCPKGWHVPTDAEWAVLENYLMANGFNNWGTTTGKNYAKALASTTLWHLDTYPGDGTVGKTDYPDKRNVTGFTALPGSFRDQYGYVFQVNYSGYWWSATAEDATVALGRYISYDDSDFNLYRNHVNSGLSVRCLKD